MESGKDNMTMAGAACIEFLYFFSELGGGVTVTLSTIYYVNSKDCSKSMSLNTPLFCIYAFRLLKTLFWMLYVHVNIGQQHVI